MSLDFPRIRLRFSITIGDGPAPSPTPSGPDTEAQIGTHHDTGWVDTGVGFVTPAMQPLEDDE